MGFLRTVVIFTETEQLSINLGVNPTCLAALLNIFQNASIVLGLTLRSRDGKKIQRSQFGDKVSDHLGKYDVFDSNGEFLLKLEFK